MEVASALIHRPIGSRTLFVELASHLNSRSVVKVVSRAEAGKRDVVVIDHDPAQPVIYNSITSRRHSLIVRLVLGLAITAVAFVLAGRRVFMLYRLARAGQPVEPGRTRDVGTRLWTVVTEVFGQRKLLKWSVPGVAHFAVFWGFVILAATIVEGFGALFQRDFHIPLIGTDTWLGFLEDLFIVAVLAGLVVFALIRLFQSPKRAGRKSRFFGSHLGPAWFVLFMIFNVMWTLLLYRGAQINTGNFPYPHGAFASEAVARLLEPLGPTANEVLETVGILLSLGVVLSFL